jgi:hypothetical protein
MPLVRGALLRHPRGLGAATALALAREGVGGVLAKFVVLWQFVGDGIPRRLGPDKNVCGWANSQGVAERSQSDVSELALANNRKQKTSADLAMNIMGRVLVTENQQVALSLSNN